MNVSTSNARAVAAEGTGFAAAWSRREPAALEFLPRHPAADDVWERRFEETARTPPARDVFLRAARDGERLGADGLSRENAEALAAGRARCVTTGQQPALLLGPLYTVYKAMSAVALARRAAEKSGEPVVPVFWNAADDSDFAEAASTVFPDADLKLARHTLDGGDLPAGGMVGHLGLAGTKRVVDELRAELERRPHGDVVLAHLARGLERARDHGELATALLYDLLRGTGLVIVDARWPELRRAASPLFVRYAARRAEVGDAVAAAGRRLEAAGWSAPVPDATSAAALFEIVEGRRVPFSADDGELARRADHAPETLSPNVVLRPIVQDTLFPNVATIGGPGEIAYHAQIAPAYDALDARMPILFPRFAATLVPDGVTDLAERRGAPLIDFVRDFDRALRDTADAAIPAELRRALDDWNATFGDGLDAVRSRATAFDPKLDDAVQDVAKRTRDALDRLRERVAKAARQAESRRDPRVSSYREFLRPRGVPQERVVNALTLFLESPEHPLSMLEDALREHLVSARAGEPLHWLLPFRGGTEGGTE
ncbi:MAG: bacillithiol biosynthesis cysteine-adding enzyme BshC [bacterium]